MDALWPLLSRSLALSGLVAGASLGLGTGLAWVAERAAYRGARVLGVLTLLPLAVPSYLLAAIVREVFGPGGVVGEALGVASSFTGFWPAAFVLTLSTTPYVQLLVQAALARTDASQEEAARGLGASPWRRFRELSVPVLRPTWAYAFALVALYVLSDFGAVAILDVEVLTWELYKAQGARDAVLLGAGIMALVLPLLVGVRLLAGRSGPTRGTGRGRVAARVRLRGRGLAAAVTMQALVISVAVVVPVAVLGTWVARGVAHGHRFAPLLSSLADTTLATFAGATVVLVVALAPAWTVARGRLSRAGAAWVENLTYLTSALPGVLVAFGLLELMLGLRRAFAEPSAGADAWAALEGAGVLLMVGYITRFVAEGYGAAMPALRRFDVRLEEAARGLGAGPMRRLRQVVLPSVAPGLGAAFVLLVLAIVKELPVTLMLTPLGTQPLAYRIFDAYNEASLPDVGASGLVLLALATAVHVGLLRWRRHA